MHHDEDHTNRPQNKGKRDNPKDHLELNPDDYKFIVGIKYTKAAIQHYFYSNLDKLCLCTKVILKTPSGLEFGTVCIKSQKITDAGIPPAKVIGYIEREATSSDKNILNHIRTQKEPEEMEYCKQRILSRGMKMKLVSIEHIFSGEKVIFYFIADGRVDFRELVKDLARRYRTRIEMRQIGVRDEAKMLSDYEHCGRELCCRTFINDLEPVTMRMAKMQKTTLDPSKISGHCGRLMCCLRFEDEVYKDHKNKLPRKGDIITTADHSGIVQSCQLLSKDIQICCNGGSIETVNLADVTSHEPAKKSSNGSSGRRTPDRDCKEPINSRPTEPLAAEPSPETDQEQTDEIEPNTEA